MICKYCGEELLASQFTAAWRGITNKGLLCTDGLHSHFPEVFPLDEIIAELQMIEADLR